MQTGRELAGARGEGSGAESDRVKQLIDRPAEVRRREYQYRFAQTVVFGLPVTALALWARVLDPVHHERWGTVMQALLAGWVMYVNAGMVVEGILVRRVTGDLVASLIGAGIYLWSLGAAVHILVDGRVWYRPILFGWSVAVMAIWTGARWAMTK
ncbi:MAG TPA: hypothetical protein VF669_18060 [Tepidisphaeraceae bacterium]|jgi:hypothetical protein